MIPNPDNVFEELQNDVATALMQATPFSGLKFPDGRPFIVLTEDEGDIQYQYDRMIADIGIAITVHSPTGEIAQPDIPGPLISNLSFDVWISEAPAFNRGPTGTQLRLAKAMGIVFGTLHGLQPQSVNSPIYATGFDKNRERVYDSKDDRAGRLITSRILHFKCPQVAAVISSP